MNHKKLSILLFGVGMLLGQMSSTAQEVLTLEAARKMALENNRQIQQAELNIEASKAALASAKSADKPTVDASVVGLYLGEPMQSLLPEYSLNGSLALSEVIYAGGKIRNGKKIAQSAWSLQTSQKELTTSDILLQTETAYWQLVSLNEQVLLASKYLSLLDSLHQDLNNSYDAGVINKNDVLRVEVQKNDAQIGLQEATDGLEMSKRVFAQLIGLSSLDFDLVKEVPAFSSVYNQMENAETAVSQRPEIAMLQESVKMQDLQTDLLIGDRRPTLAVTLNGIYAAGNHVNFADGSDDFTSMIGLVSLNVPILDWGGRKQKVKEQQAIAKAQQLELDETMELLQLEIRNAYLELKRSATRVTLSEASLAQAKENLRLLNDQFETGTITGKDVLEGQVLWQEAYAQLINAKAALKINEANYLKAIASY